ncbi:MAG: hypothetical protein EOP04_03770 [Proteobacteria bacterium]|nr:MAG: hypothetical protein EOP04_03770 [Pseudomonadota bacterium]
MSEKYKTFLLVSLCVLGLLHLLRELNQMRDTKVSREEAAEAAKDSLEAAKDSLEAAKESLAAKKLRDYLDCNIGRAACDRLYPEAAKEVSESKGSDQTNNKK